MTSLIIGTGEVGRALSLLIPEARTWDIQHGKPITGQYDFVHIAFGYSPAFVENVAQYIERWLAPDGVCIIHSTVPAGTTRKVGPRAVHSPVHGKHPNLTGGLKTFRKFVGGTDRGLVEKAAEHLRQHGMKALPVTNPETSELSKRWCLRQYAMSILLEKFCAADCERHGANREEVYEWWNLEYNEGWKRLGYDRYRRPVLDHMPGPIGGHCVLQNSEHTPWEEIDHIILELARNL